MTVLLLPCLEVGVAEIRFPVHHWRLRLVGGPEDPLFRELREAAARHGGGRLRLAVAWVNQEGAGLLRDVVSPAKVAVDAVVGINNRGTTLEGMLEMLDLARSLRVLYQHPFVTFHPKVYCFDGAGEDRLIVGSSNLTGGGLDSNFELSLATPLDDDLRGQWTAYWTRLQKDPFCFEVSSAGDVERLYRLGHLLPEESARRR